VPRAGKPRAIPRPPIEPVAAQLGSAAGTSDPHGNAAALPGPIPHLIALSGTAPLSAPPPCSDGVRPSSRPVITDGRHGRALRSTRKHPRRAAPRGAADRREAVTEFTWRGLEGARVAQRRLLERLGERVARDADHPLTYEEAAARLEGPGRSYLERLDEAISTDLNTAQALAVLTRVSRDDEIGRDALGVLGAVFEAVLAFGLLDLEPKDIEPSAGKFLLAPDEIDQLLGEREDARRRGDFAVADEIRDMLERLGIEVRDTPGGAVLIAKRPSRKHRPPTSDSAAPPG
jgi:hypothetical protein